MTGTVIFDFDLTLVPHESLVEVLRRSLVASNQAWILPYLTSPKPDSICELTHGLKTLRAGREALASIRRHHIDTYVLETLPTLDLRLTRLIKALQARGIKVCVLSNAYLEWLLPVADYLDIPPTQVWGNQFYWGRNRIIAPRPSPLLVGHCGKAKLVQKRRQHNCLPGPIIVVGDGRADHHIFQSGQADAFIQATYYRVSPLPEVPQPSPWFQAETIDDVSALVWDFFINPAGEPLVDTPP